MSIAGQPRRFGFFLRSHTKLGLKWKPSIIWRLIRVPEEPELCGLLWKDVDLTIGQIAIVQQLVKPGAPPLFGPPKNGKPRTITLTPKTVELLRYHKAQQAQTKLANRGIYQDFGLVFAKDWWGMRTHGDTLGHPLQSNTIGQGEFKRLIAMAGVKRIKFHGLRHNPEYLLIPSTRTMSGM